MQPRAPLAAGQGEEEEEEEKEGEGLGPLQWLCAGARAGFLGSRKLRALTIPK